MWQCLKCKEDVEDHFDLCWNCQANRRGLRQFGELESDELEDQRVKAIVNKRHKPMNCLRCFSVLIHAGTKNFGELLVAKQTLEMYVCSECGHVEFFAFGD